MSASFVRRFALLSATLLLWGCSSSGPGAPEEPEGAPVLLGTVVAAGSGAPVFTASVAVEPTGASDVTDANGRFRFELDPGAYTVVVERAGFRTVRSDVVVPPGEERVTVEIALPPFPVLDSGHGFDVSTRVTSGLDEPTITWTVAIENDGDEVLEGVTIADTLDERLGPIGRDDVRLGAHPAFAEAGLEVGEDGRTIFVTLESLAPLAEPTRLFEVTVDSPEPAGVDCNRVRARAERIDAVLVSEDVSCAT